MMTSQPTVQEAGFNNQLLYFASLDQGACTGAAYISRAFDRRARINEQFVELNELHAYRQ